MNSALLIVVCAGPGYAEDVRTVHDPETVSLVQKLAADLQKAIQSRDYSGLRSDHVEARPLEWHDACGSGESVKLSFDEVMQRLGLLSRNSTLAMTSRPLMPLSVLMVETTGWSGETPYAYFEFKTASDSWRWVGVYACSKQDPDFGYVQRAGADAARTSLPDEAKADEVQGVDAEKLTGLIASVKDAVLLKDFAGLKKYVPDVKLYDMGDCDCSDCGFDEITFEAMTEMLLRDSKDVDIYLGANPGISQWGDSSLHANILTEGWASEYPYVDFSFKRLPDSSRWEWVGICVALGPPFELNERTHRFERVYPRRPLLPRPGPRVFSNYAELQFRIEEIVQFQSFDALRPYAVRSKLVIGPCSRKMMDQDRVLGKSVPIQDAIAFLKKNGLGPAVTRTNASRSTMYESKGWSGDYPYIAFWLAPEKEGWELTGISYCKEEHAGLLLREERGGVLDWLKGLFR